MPGRLHHSAAAGGAEKRREASLDNLGAQYTYFTKICAFYRQKDEQRVTRFCDVSKLAGFVALTSLQDKIMQRRLDSRIKASERKIAERMKSVSPTPRGLKGMIHREALPHYIFYGYIRGNKPKNGYCTACRHDVLVSGAKHNAAGKCPHCGKAVTFKASGRAGRVWDRVTVQALQNHTALRTDSKTSDCFCVLSKDTSFL